MNVEKLSKYGIEDWFIKKLKSKGINKLYKHQEDVLKRGLLNNKNFVIAVPTASGKTLISMFAFFHHLKKRRKIVYLVPLVSLANEKYDEFREYFDRYRVALSVGDYDSADPYLENYDIIVCTVEKFDSLIRHKAHWMNDIGLVVIDEVHMINDPSRGPTLEIVLTRVKEMFKNVQIIALSATIANVDELAEWLNAEYVISDFRPVRLVEGVLLDDIIKFSDGKEISIKQGITPEEKITRFVLGKKKKQILFFVSTRKKTERLANKLADVVEKYIDEKERSELAKISNEIISVLESPTDQCEKLAELVKRGIAFHHSGLLYKQRKIIEENFRKGLIKVIVATTGLAYGVNLPSYCVVIRDLKRYYPGIGTYYIPVLEYIQMVGRAGRPKYDKEGIALTIAKNEEIMDEILTRFIHGEPEELKSKLGNELVLRSQTLAFISIERQVRKERLNEFFSRTFFAFQYGDVSEILDRIHQIIDKLNGWKFVEVKNDLLKITVLGKRVSELYLDPKSANLLINGISKYSKERNKYDEFSLLSLIANTSEMRFLARVGNREFDKIISFIISNENKFLFDVPSEWDLEFEYFIPSVKIAKILYDWINELPENDIVKKYNITPGDLRSIVEIADWMLYSLAELARLSKAMNIISNINKLRTRVRYGVKEELLKFVRLEGIGRVRARKLFMHGIRTIDQLRKIPSATLSFILGPKIAKKVKDQLVINEKQKSLKDL